MVHVKAFVFTGDRNSESKPDYVGAFDPEARGFMKLHNIPSECRLRVNLGKGERERRQQILGFIEEMRQKGYTTNSFAFFCHGFANRIELGFKIANIKELVTAMKSVSSGGDSLAGAFTVPLYCCSTGDGPGKDGDNGFADKLRDEMCVQGFTNCVVDAHVTAGHTTMNSMKRRYMGMGSTTGGVGGLWVVGPKTTLWRKWRESLKTDFRYKFPYMTIGEIHGELSK